MGSKPPLFAWASDAFRVRDDVPFQLGCCQCGFFHLVIIKVGPRREITVTMYRDEDATETDRISMTDGQWRKLRAECDRRLKALRRKGK